MLKFLADREPFRHWHGCAVHPGFTAERELTIDGFGNAQTYIWTALP